MKLNKWGEVLALCAAIVFVIVTAVSAAPPADFTNFDGVLLGDGSASAPSLSFSSDTDTGLYRVGANAVGIGVNGAKVLDVNATGLDVTGALTTSGSQTNSNWFKVSAPTAIATATPALVVNSAGVSRLVELQKNSTPVAAVDGSGNATFSGNLTVTGNINGVKCYKGQQTVLGAATAIPATLTAAGISTPTWAEEGFAASPGDTYWNHSHTNAAGVVTFNVYQNMLSGTVTPQAATTSVALDYQVCGN